MRVSSDRRKCVSGAVAIAMAMSAALYAPFTSAQAAELQVTAPQASLVDTKPRENWPPKGRWDNWKGPVHLRITSGVATLPRMAVWLANGMEGIYPYSDFTSEILFTGSGYKIEMDNLRRKEADVAITTLAGNIKMSMNGNGLYKEANPNVRALLRVGQRDFVSFAVPADLGVSSFEEIIEKRIPIKLATNYVDGNDVLGFVLQEVLAGYGTSMKEMESWGCKFVHYSWLLPTFNGMLAGEADSIFQEADAIMWPQFKVLHARRPMKVLSIREDVLVRLEKLGFKRFPVIKAGSYPGVTTDVQTLDYSDFYVLANADLPDEIAYNLVKGAAETTAQWNKQDPDLGDETTGAFGNMKVDPKLMWRTDGIPLHPGAAKYYKEKGLIP